MYTFDYQGGAGAYLEITVELLCRLFRYRWSAPILAELRRSDGCKYVTLRHRVGAADGSLRQSLDWLIENEWATRNPGYGHPSRPEYILTEAGQPLAARCDATVCTLSELGALQIGLNKWTLPVLHQIASGATRFAELRRAVPAVTPRALAQTLREIVEAGLVIRSVTAGIPVAITYRLSGTGQRLTEISALKASA